MSVLIKGIEIPKNCLECMFRISYWKRALTPSCKIFTYGCMLNGKEINTLEKRCKDCPIVEIPTPHGRLIDADKLQTAIHGCLCENCQTFPCEKGIGCLIEDVFNLLDEAPTIIEAEVSE